MTSDEQGDFDSVEAMCIAFGFDAATEAQIRADMESTAEVALLIADDDGPGTLH